MKELVISSKDNIIYKTHVDILNNLFGKNYKGHQKASYIVNEYCWVWFPKFEKDKFGNIKVAPSGWKNSYNKDYSVITTEPPVPKQPKKNNDIVLIFAMLEPQEYYFLGAYEFDDVNSNEHIHIRRRITNKVNLIGNPVNKIELMIEDSKCFYNEVK